MDNEYIPGKNSLGEDPEKPKAIISDGKYAIQAFQDRVEIWGIGIIPGMKLATFNSVESLVKSIGRIEE